QQAILTADYWGAVALTPACYRLRTSGADHDCRNKRTGWSTSATLAALRRVSHGICSCERLGVTIRRTTGAPLARSLRVAEVPGTEGCADCFLAGIAFPPACRDGGRSRHAGVRLSSWARLATEKSCSRKPLWPVGPRPVLSANGDAPYAGATLTRSRRGYLSFSVSSPNNSDSSLARGNS